MGRILVVDDEPAMCAAIGDVLRGLGHEASSCHDADSALEIMTDEDFDVVVTDIAMRGMNGVELCHRIVHNRADVPVIAISANTEPRAAIALVRAGAFDFLVKPFEPDAFVLAVERALRERQLRHYVRRLEVDAGSAVAIDGLIGSSRAMNRLCAVVRRAAMVDATVFVTGESGTGKEVVARSIHALGARADRPFVALNCASVSPHLVESELFGHVRGAFTDAASDKEGLFVRADGGTLFLDEVAEMSLDMQAKLLRALQERRIRPVGGSRELPFDARVITATHGDVEAMVRDGKFREDLYYRLHVMEIAVPPLRERGNDVLELARHFMARATQRHGKDVRDLAPDASRQLSVYPWPGNVRELANAMERAVVMAAGTSIRAADLPDKIASHRPPLDAGGALDELVPMAEVERRYILQVMQAVGGNKSRASRILGIDRATLQRRLEQYESDPRAEGA
ncbi:MAG: sigma-54-dependent Fis family transcriptional regulator [Deltaproteobacteria bacterium]|nr:sigma-54-dependent Fis family transcriptional regulator [Deltaproteobacteria bacterium]